MPKRDNFNCNCLPLINAESQKPKIYLKFDEWFTPSIIAVMQSQGSNSKS